MKKWLHSARLVSDHVVDRSPDAPDAHEALVRGTLCWRLRSCSSRGLPGVDARPRTGRRRLTGLCATMCDTSHMATNLSIDPKLLEEALELSGERTKTAAVVRALKEFIARRRQKGILDLFGKLDWNPDFEPKRERSRR